MKILEKTAASNQNYTRRWTVDTGRSTPSLLCFTYQLRWAVNSRSTSDNVGFFAARPLRTFACSSDKHGENKHQPIHRCFDQQLEPKMRLGSRKLNYWIFLTTECNVFITLQTFFLFFQKRSPRFFRSFFLRVLLTLRIENYLKENNGKHIPFSTYIFDMSLTGLALVWSVLYTLSHSITLSFPFQTRLNRFPFRSHFVFLTNRRNIHFS